MDIFERLKEQFPPERVSFRGSKFIDGKPSAPFLAYIDARDVMERLDEVVGPENWSDTYFETASGRVICNIEIGIPESLGTTSKADGAGDTGLEGEKGAISDAFKRAAVKWGIGRYLYSLPRFNSPEDGQAYLKKIYDRPDYMEKVREHWDSIVFIKGQLNYVGRDEAHDNSAHSAALEAWRELGNDDMMILWRAPSKGGVFTTEERRLLKEAASEEVRLRNDTSKA